MNSLRNAGFCCLLGLLAATSAFGQAPVRVTGSVELPQLRAFLQRVAKSCTKGFTRDEATRLAEQINGLATEKPGNWEFQALCKGEAQELKVKALVDELSRVELDFLTTSAMAVEIRAALTGLPAR